MPTQKKNFPIEWDFVYTGIFDPNKNYWYYQESGCVFINKELHSKEVSLIYYLNDNWKETYKPGHGLGDKETFWMAFAICDKEFYMNDVAGTNVPLDKDRPNCCTMGAVLTHLYKGKTFFSQKGYPLSV